MPVYPALTLLVDLKEVWNGVIAIYMLPVPHLVKEFAKYRGWVCGSSRPQGTILNGAKPESI